MKKQYIHNDKDITEKNVSESANVYQTFNTMTINQDNNKGVTNKIILSEKVRSIMGIVPADKNWKNSKSKFLQDKYDKR
jgi:hypothetical protein